MLHIEPDFVELEKRKIIQEVPDKMHCKECTSMKEKYNQVLLILWVKCSY